MKLLPYLASFVTSYIGWFIGKPLGIFAATLLSLILGVVGFYYGHKYQKQLLG